jgi:myo-inositol-1(or 4)-monophosphatase
MSNSREYEFAQALAREAGEELKRRFNDPMLKRVTRKGINLQTLADVKANKLILKSIKEYYPDHEIKSEETADRPAFNWNYNSEYVWIVDPCDGTVNFASDIPFFSVSIALAYRAEVIIGVVFDPIRNEMFSAEKTKGAMLNGNPISVSGENALADATFGIDIAHNVELFEREIKILRSLVNRVRVVRSFFSGALELCYVGSGRIDIRIDDSFKPWDIAAGALIALEAGARVTDLHNRDWTLNSKDILAANHTLHQLVIETLE